MAKYYYRLDNTFQWQGTSGNAIVAFVNKLGSGKVITFKNIEAVPITSVRNLIPYALTRATSIIGGDTMTLTAYDGNASTLPSTLRIARNCGVGGNISPMRRSTEWWPIVTPAGSNPATLSPLGISGYYLTKRNRGYFYDSISSVAEPITLRNNENIAIVGQLSGFITPVMVDVEIIYNNKTYSTTFYALLSGNENLCPVGISNTTGNIVRITKLNIKPAGTTDTPFLRIVPIAGIQSEAMNATQQKISFDNFVKYDTNSPTLTESIMLAYNDVGVVPFGVPMEYASGGGAAAPKGVNYLHTKDYLGPEYMVYFPEMRTSTPDAFRDDLGFTMSKKYSRIKRDITIREGEGIAIVSSAETLTSWGGTASWAVNFGFDIEVADIEYTLTLINIKAGSEVRIYSSGSTTEIAGQETVNTGTFTYSYTYAPNMYVDIVVHHTDYLYYRLENYLLGNSNSTVPIQQITDRQYLNP